MSNNQIKNTTYDESILGYAAATFVPMTRPAVRNSHSETGQDMTETDANDQVSPVKRERVYLHSIGRFSKLRKLQMGTYDD
jgi:hypothetical protein